MIQHISIDKLIKFGVSFMKKRGVSEDHALYTSRIVVETEAFRQSTHGLAQFTFLNGALGKTIDPKAEPVIISNQGASALVDGAGSIGHIAVKLARELAVETARVQGTAFVAVRNTEWIGAVGMHLIPIAENGLLCQAWAQSNTCKDCAPFGGIDPRFSTNPIALAFPADGNPVIADFSTATMSFSSALAMIQKGEIAAIPRFLDKAGIPCTDPSVMKQDGTLMFMGGDIDGHKGYALSPFNEALTVLAGGSANNPDARPAQSFLLMVLDPSAFGGTDYYFKEMRRFLGHVKSSRVRSTSEKIRLPGERGFASLADCRNNGVPLDDSKIELLQKIADENEIDMIG